MGDASRVNSVNVNLTEFIYREICQPVGFADIANFANPVVPVDSGLIGVFFHTLRLTAIKVYLEEAPAPVAQWIEQRFPKPCAEVRFFSGALGSFGQTKEHVPFGLNPINPAH